MEAKSTYYCLVFFFILNWIGTGFMQATTQLQARDSLQSRPELVEFDESSIEAYQADEDYNYFKTNNEESAWQKFQNWLTLQWNKFLDWLLSGISEGNFWNYVNLILKILFISGIVVLIAWLFNKYYITTPKSSPNNEAEIHWSEEERLMQQKDLMSLIRSAESNGDFRLASRYWFLNLLKHLKDQHWIEYQFQKTNADYRAEIENEKIKADFSSLSRFYEFVWYGDFDLKAQEFANAKTKFEELTTKILNTRAHG